MNMTHCCHVYFVMIEKERESYEDRQADRNLVGPAAGRKDDSAQAGREI